MPDRKTLVVWTAVFVGGLFFLWLIWTPLWLAIGAIWQLLLYVLNGILQIFVTAFELIASAIVYLVSFAMWLAVVFVIGLLASYGLKLLLARIGELGAQVQKLGEMIGEDSRRSAKDALFLSLLAFVLALVVYAATDDFIERFSALRFLAACGIGFCIAKLFLMYPSRLAKAGGAILTLVLAIACFLFLNHRYGLIGDLGHGFPELRKTLFPSDPHLAESQFIKLMVAIAIGTLSALAIAYPFGATQWQKMLRG